MPPIRVAVTGACGQIGYAFLPLLCRGLIFGETQDIILHLLDIPPMQTSLQGVVMELQDCAYPLLRPEILATSDPMEAFRDVEYCVMLGAMPRKEGMQRKDLLKSNVSIFKEQGEALDKVARKQVRVVVVGNPANTNALICMHYAPSIPKQQFSALTRLDELRAKSMTALKLGINVGGVTNVTVWGNHSGTQFPDLRGSSVVGEVEDGWRVGEFVRCVSTRGAEVIKARKLSSAMSAANAVAEHLKSWHVGTPGDTFTSMAVISDTNPYHPAIPSGLIFSFPVRIRNGRWTIVPDLPCATDEFGRGMIERTVRELVEERDEAMVYLTGSKM